MALRNLAWLGVGLAAVLSILALRHTASVTPPAPAPASAPTPASLPPHSGRSAVVGPNEGRIRARYRAGGAISAQPIEIPAGRVVVATHAGQLHCVARDGSPIWSRDLEGPIWGTPHASPGGRIHAGSDAGSLFELSFDGEELSRTAVGAPLDTGIVAGAGGRLYFAAGRMLFAVDGGGPSWRFEAGAKIFTTPAIADDGTVLFGSQDDHLYALSPKGELRWAHRTAGDVDSSPTIGPDGTIYFGSDDGRVRALTPDGGLLFAVDVGGMVRAPVALASDGVILVATLGPRPRLLALDGRTGRVVWTYATELIESTERGLVAGPVVDSRGDIYLGAHDGLLHALSSRGRLRFTVALGGRVLASPTLGSDGTLWVGTEEGVLHAIGGAAPPRSAEGSRGDRPRR